MAASAELVQRVRARVGVVLNGKWRLERVLGMGGMAAVYAAVHRNQSRVAIKMLHPELSLDQSVTSRFLREGYAANTVEHAGTVRIFDDDVSEDGAAFLVMELLEGETLDERAGRMGGKLPVGEVLVLIDQLLDVLAAAHEKGMVHRDIKPDNLFLTVGGKLKVLDFGIARLRELSAPASGSTAVGTFLGTPAYMAPEQARGRWDDVDSRSDVWATGATMFALLTGRCVHEAETVNEQLVAAVTTPAPSLAEFAPDLGGSVIGVVDRALCHDKANRWQGAREMQIALRSALTGVELPSSISVPAATIKRPGAEAESSTLLLPPDAFTELATGSGAALAITSTDGVDGLPARRSRKPLYAAGAIALAIGAGMLGVKLANDRSESEPSALESVTNEPSAPLVRPSFPTRPSVSPTSGGDTPTVLPGVPVDDRASAPDDSSRVSPAALARPQRNPAAQSARSDRTSKAPPATSGVPPAATFAPVGKPAASGRNPFDRRY